MVLRFDAVVADAAVVAPGRPPNVAGFAVLCGYFHGCCAGGGGFYEGPVVCGGPEGEGVFVFGDGGHGVEVAGEDLEVHISEGQTKRREGNVLLGRKERRG